MRASLALTTSLVLLVGGSIPVAPPSAGDEQLECLGEPVTIRVGLGQEAVGTSGSDVIWGTSGPDIIHARDGRDRVCGNGGRDHIYGGRGTSWRNGSLGDHLSGGPGRDVLHGGPGPDHLRGGTGRDELHGGMGYDDFILFGGGDTVYGGQRSDLVLYGGVGAAVIVDMQLGVGQIIGARTSDRLVGVEDVAGTRFADVLRGNDHGNRLLGGEGDDVLDGRGGGLDVLLGDRGDDHVSGGPGRDSLEGGPGYDVLDGGPGLDGCTLGERVHCEFDQLW